MGRQRRRLCRKNVLDRQHAYAAGRITRLLRRAGGRNGESIECDRRAIAEFERVGHGSGRAIGYSNLAFKLAAAGRYDEAVEECEQAEQISRKIGRRM